MIRIFIDGACSGNPGPMGVGIVIEWQGKQPEIISEYHGKGTSNIAEYKALLRSLEVIKENQIMDVELNGDSNLVVNQMKKVLPKLNSQDKIKGFKCNDLDLIELRNLARDRIKYLQDRGYKIILNHIDREFNLADKPAKNGYLKFK